MDATGPAPVTDTEADMGDVIVKAAEAQEHLQDLFDRVRAGEEVLISEGDRVFAKIAPVKKKRTPGLTPGVARMAPDFDDPLPDSFWSGEK